MNNKVTAVSSKNLLPGMVLGKNIRENELSLLTKGTILTEDLIKNLQKLYPFSFVYVYENNDDIRKNLSKDSIEKSRKTERVFVKFSDNMDDLLKKVQVSSQANVEEIREISKSILNSVEDYGYALKSITNERAIDEYLVRHSVNVSVLSSMLGNWMGLSERELTLLTYAGLLHDIGKTKIDPYIINKTSKLSKEDFDTIKKHPILAYEIVKKLPFIDPSVCQAVLMHHEKIDGSGYPFGLKNDKIPLYAKIIGVVDMFDAMTSNKVYSPKKSPFEVLEILQKDYINKLDTICLTTFIHQMSIYYTGEMVKLNTEDIAKVVKMDVNDIGNPLILLNEEFIDLKTRKDLFIEDLYS